MKAAVCVRCVDLVAPIAAWKTNRSWRWCQCDQTGVRWLDGRLGLLEVTAHGGPNDVRILGLNNAFLQPAVAGIRSFMTGDDEDEEWRILHDLVCEKTPSNYLFSESRRECWAIVFAVGETGDVTFVDWMTARASTTHAVRAPDAL
jgi:hypothetical protein